MISTMSQVKREQLSTLIDDELEPAEVQAALSEMSGDQELRALWDRYHLMGDALRGEPLNREARQIADRVRERLAAEPVTLIPRSRGIPRRWIGPVFGSALAASVAAVALIAGPEWMSDDISAPGQPLQIAENTGNRVPPEALYVDHTGTYWNLKRPEVESKLNSYLVNHQEYAPSTGMKGMLPFATFVSYDARR
jgi:sigma-E factor negative regulatory protein RseA